MCPETTNHCFELGKIVLKTVTSLAVLVVRSVREEFKTFSVRGNLGAKSMKDFEKSLKFISCNSFPEECVLKFSFDYFFAASYMFFLERVFIKLFL